MIRALQPIGMLLLSGCLGAVTPPGQREADDGTGEDSAQTGDDASTAPTSSLPPQTGTGSTGGDPGSSSAEGTVSASASTTGATQELVEVSHRREFRAAWVASVFNINYPSTFGLSPEQLEQEMVDMVDLFEVLNLNAMILQVRGEGDALYASDLEPWSRRLTGIQGVHPGVDPLALAVELAHARGIEVHAWLNPFRGSIDSQAQVTPTHVTAALSQHAIEYGPYLWMDPGSQEVHDWIADVSVDIVDRYDVDGVQFDDYFYPYRSHGSFDDADSWNDYQSSGGTLSLGNWRRDNINRFVERIHDEMLAADPSVRFGISPFGIYRPGVPPGITGLDQYNALFADPLEWIERDWLDYVAPQLYWSTQQPAQAYDVLLDWWSSLPPDGQHVFSGIALYKLDTDPTFDVDEILLQVELARTDPNAAAGSIFYNVSSLQSDAHGVATALVDEVYQRPALTPPLGRAKGSVPLPPSARRQGSGPVLVEHEDRAGLRAFAAYLDRGRGFELERVFGADVEEMALDPGRWAISACDRYGLESQGAVVEID